MGVESSAYLCDRYSQEEIKQIPHISTSVKAALDFLSKDDDGFFLMYEQGDVRLFYGLCL
jgi:alkaline phosphatase